MNPTAKPKVPRTPPAALQREPGDVLAVAPRLWRIHRTRGAHVIPWNELRRYGPLPSMRFDPHPPPLGEHDEGVLYAGTSLTTALAETFQATRVIDTVSYQPQLAVWTPNRPLQLLDLTGTWALRNQGAHALSSAPRTVCRAWARAIRATWADLDGLWVASTMTGEPNVALWNPARTALPSAPEFSRPLADPTLHAIIARIAATDLSYEVD